MFAATLDFRADQARDFLTKHRQAHVLEGWPALNSTHQEALLHQIAAIPWDQMQALFRELVQEKKKSIQLPAGPWEPAVPLTGRRDAARDAGLQVLRHTGNPLYGLLVVAGGTGSGLKFPHPKGLFPATPLSGTPLYQSIIEKSKAAARAYGQPRMYPILFMVSDETERETLAYFEERDYFGERDRILLARQQLLPLLDRRPGHEGRAVMRNPGEIYLGGAGHGDAFDYTLTADATAAGWLQQWGVRYLQFLNVDNLLNPVGDPHFLGEHILSESPSLPEHAHISVIMIPKTVERMGNIIQFKQEGRLVQKSIDYGMFPEVDARCELGHASLQIVTLSSLPGTLPIPFMAAAKEVQVEGVWRPVWKFERSSNNKARYGALLRRESDDVFAPIKKPSDEAPAETPAAAARLQSEHWKRILSRAGLAGGRPFHFAASTVIELPWEAEHLPPDVLASSLQKIRFPAELKAETGYQVLPDFEGFQELSIRGGIP